MIKREEFIDILNTLKTNVLKIKYWLVIQSKASLK